MNSSLGVSSQAARVRDRAREAGEEVPRVGVDAVRLREDVDEGRQLGPLAGNREDRAAELLGPGVAGLEDDLEGLDRLAPVAHAEDRALPEAVAVPVDVASRHRLVTAPAEDVGRRIAEEPFGPRVPEDDPVRGVDREDGLAAPGQELEEIFVVVGRFHTGGGFYPRA